MIFNEMFYKYQISSLLTFEIEMDHLPVNEMPKYEFPNVLQKDV